MVDRRLQNIDWKNQKLWKQRMVNFMRWQAMKKRRP